MLKFYFFIILKLSLLSPWVTFTIYKPGKYSLPKFKEFPLFTLNFDTIIPDKADTETSIGSLDTVFIEILNSSALGFGQAFIKNKTSSLELIFVPLYNLPIYP